MMAAAMRWAVHAVALLVGMCLAAPAIAADAAREELIRAAGKRSPAQVEALLRRIGRARIDDAPPGGVTALLNAADNNPDSAVALMLLRHGADPLRDCGGGWSPLAAALAGDRIDLVRAFAERARIADLPDRGARLFPFAVSLTARDLLVEHGARAPRYELDSLRTWYFHTARSGTAAQLRRILDEIGRDRVNDVDGQGSSALLLAVSENPDPAVALLLLESGVDPALDDPSYPLLRRAAEKGYADVVRVLVRRGAVERSPDQGASAYLSASPALRNLLAELGVPEPKPTVRELLYSAATATPSQIEDLVRRLGREHVDDTERGGQTALEIAVERNPDPQVAMTLLRLGAAPVREAAGAGRTAPLAVAARKDQLELVRALARHGAVENAPDRGATAFDAAPSLEMARLLLALGARPYAEPGGTPLLGFSRRHAPRHRGTRAQVLALLAAGADVRAREQVTGETALHFVAATNDASLLRALIDAGADVDARTSAGETPLQRAVQSAAIETAKVLLERGAAVDARGAATMSRGHEGSETPLVMALLTATYPTAPDATPMVRLLLSHGASPEPAKDAATGAAVGRSPLVLASGDARLTRLLLDAGADPAQADGAGLRALDVTRSEEVADLLIAAGAGTATERLLDRGGISPALLNRLRAIARAAGNVLLPFSGFLVGWLAPAIVLLAQRRRGRSSPAARGALVWVAGYTALAVLLTVAGYFAVDGNVYYGWGIAMLLPFVGAVAVGVALLGAIVGAIRGGEAACQRP